MRKFAKGMIIGTGIGCISGVATTIIMAALIEATGKEKTENLYSILENMKGLKKTPETVNEYSDLEIDINFLGETSIVNTLKNINKAIELEEKARKKLRGFLNEDIKN